MSDKKKKRNSEDLRVPIYTVKMADYKSAPLTSTESSVVLWGVGGGANL